MRTTLWRAMERDGWTGQMSCWSEGREAAEAYQDNPGFGGPVLHSTEVEWEYVLDLTGTPSEAWTALARALGESADDLAAEADYPWDVWEGNPERIARLRRDYTWIRYDDNFPDHCVTWVYLETAPLAAQAA